MNRRLALSLIGTGLFLQLLPLLSGAFAQDTGNDNPEPPKKDPELSARPITTAPGEVGDLLRKWWREGTASGNVGDMYDNRDGAHSQLDLTPYPQLRQLAYTEQDKKLGKHWAAQRVILPGVVFGNSSTSAPFLLGGSNVRMYYTLPRGLDFLYQQYTRNNLYIYPEHRDHDPGHNGSGDGYGDAFPTNTPFVITSQGSSGSDQPFMRAIPVTLAAFRPEVKKKLIKAGFLMPTVQMILRASGKQLTNADDYLTGKAHPSVFEGSQVDELKMVKMAHDIRVENIPPAIQLQVVEEDAPVLGRDFFEPGGSEKLADTPVVVARIFRGKDRTRRMVISAAKSIDLSKLPLKFHWVLLRGDPDRVRIKPLDDDKSRTEITVAHPERRPISIGSAMESNRVDIGVFVHNGHYFSAPGFVTFFSLDHEARIYGKDGTIVEIGYGLGESRIVVTDWRRAVELAAGDSAGGKLLPIAAAERAALAKELPAFQKLQVMLKKALARRDALKKSKKDNPDLVAAERTLTAAQKAVDAFLDRPLLTAKRSLRVLIANAFRDLATDVRFAEKHAAMLETLLHKADAPTRAAVDAALKRLGDLGLAKPPVELPLALGPSLSRYAARMVEHFNAESLSLLIYPGIITTTYQVNYVDPRISAPRTWRDVYRHDAKGNVEGWERFAAGGRTSFNADGHAIMKKDALGRCVEARTVRYTQDAIKRPGPNTNPLRQVLGNEIVTYEYAGDADRLGQVKERKKAE